MKLKPYINLLREKPRIHSADFGFMEPISRYSLCGKILRIVVV